MDTSKVYQDSDGNDCTIHQMVQREPSWAANRIQEGEKAIAEVERLNICRVAALAEAKHILARLDTGSKPWGLAIKGHHKVIDAKTDEISHLTAELELLKSEIAVLQTLVPHNEDGLCDCCGVSPSSVTLCDHCANIWEYMQTTNTQLFSALESAQTYINDIIQYERRDGGIRNHTKKVIDNIRAAIGNAAATF